MLYTTVFVWILGTRTQNLMLVWLNTSLTEPSPHPNSLYREVSISPKISVNKNVSPLCIQALDRGWNKANLDRTDGIWHLASPWRKPGTVPWHLILEKLECPRLGCGSVEENLGPGLQPLQKQCLEIRGSYQIITKWRTKNRTEPLQD